MTTSTEDYATGLAAHDATKRESTSGEPKGDALSGELLNLPEILELAARANHRLDQLTARLETLEDEVAKRSADINRRWEGVTDLPRSKRQDLAAKEAASFRASMVRDTAPERDGALQALGELATRAKAAAVFYQSPAQLLARAGLGSTDRARYNADLAASGPTELVHFARLAVAKRDVVLASVVLSRLDGLKPNDRKVVSFSRQQLADKMVGDDYGKAIRALSVVHHRLDTAVAVNRSFVSGLPRSAQSYYAEGLGRMNEGDVAKHFPEAA